MDLVKTGWECVNWIHLALGRIGTVTSSCEHDNEPSGYMKSGEYLD
jgi:hypothetical protein